MAVFTENARRIFSISQNEANRTRVLIITIEHVLLAAIRAGYGPKLGIRAIDETRSAELLSRIQASIADKCRFGGLGITPMRIHLDARTLAQSHGHLYVTSDHVCLALLTDPNHVTRDMFEPLGFRTDEPTVQLRKALSQRKWDDDRDESWEDKRGHH